MRNKYKKTDKIVDYNKHASILEKNLNFQSAFNLKTAKSPTNKNSLIEKAKPILNRFNRLNQQKEKENIFFKEDIYNKRDKNYRDIPSTNEKEKEQKNKKTINYNRLNLDLNSFISNDVINKDDSKREKLKDNKNFNKDIIENNVIKNFRKIILIITI